jgi:integrase
MQNLFRRPSGVYVLRLAVPFALRQVFGRREIIISSGTQELAIAKISAGLQAAQWRQCFVDATRLVTQAGVLRMDHKDILQIVQGSPILLSGGFLPLDNAAAASGISPDQLLRRAAEGHLTLAYRSSREPGYLVPLDDLELDNESEGQAGGYVIPNPAQMPKSAVAHVASGMLLLLPSDLPGAATSLLTGASQTSLVAFELATIKGMVFAPNRVVPVSRSDIEVSAIEVEQLRSDLAVLVSADRIKEARSQQKIAHVAAARKKTARGHELLSVALDHYINNRVRQHVTQQGEITRIRNGCALLIELVGDGPVSAVTTSLLRSFRSEQLSQVPANENKIRLTHKTQSITESIKAVQGTGWPVMSPMERDKRMRWILSWFAWLKSQNEWLDEDPAAPLSGESVLDKATRRLKERTGREDEARELMTQQDLDNIFGVYWFKTGKGKLTRTGTYREFCPHYYWLPLLSLFTGGARINEVSQLHLDDIGISAQGTWFVDMNEKSDDKKLKNKMSSRVVPVHPLLINLGFGDWVNTLRTAGYVRLFPELKHDTEKGYGKAATKWFTGFKSRLGIATDGKKTFHSFRHNFTNALPDDIPDRISKQLTGHTRGKGTQDRVYKKDVAADEALPYVARMKIRLPDIEPFNVEEGLRAVKDALQRKNRGRGAKEDQGGTL